MKQEFKRSEVIFETEVFKFHKFSEGDGVPILVNSAAAGRHPNIGQNLIDRCVKEGKTVYTPELLPATQRTKDTSIEDLVSGIHWLQQYICEPVDLVSLCQGTLPAAIYASIYPENVNRYVNFAGTINSKTGCWNKIEEYMKTPGIVERHRDIVENNGGIQKGILQWIAFSLVDPWETYVKRHLKAYNLISACDWVGLEKWKHDNGWHDAYRDIHGKWYLETLEWLFRDNRLYNGTFPNILGKKVQLENITCDVYLFAGEKDNITDTTQCLGMGDKVSGKVFKRILKDKGHTASFTAKSSLDIFANDFLI